MLLFNFIKDIHLYFYFIAIIFSIARYPKYFDTILKFYPIILVYTFLNELLGHLIYYNAIFFNPFIVDIYKENNTTIYNIYNIIFFSYLFYIFRHFIKNTKHKNLIKKLTYSFFLVAFINIFIKNFLLEQQLYTYIYGIIILVYCITLFLKEQKTNIKKKFIKHNFLFWLSIALLIFYIGYIPIKIYYNISNFTNVELFYTMKTIHLILICIMYSIIIYGFIQMKGKLKD